MFVLLYGLLTAQSLVVNVDSYRPFIDSIQTDSNGTVAVLMTRRRNIVNVYFTGDEGPIDYLISETMPHYRDTKIMTSYITTKHGYYATGIKDINKVIGTKITSGSLDFSPDRLILTSSFIVFYGRWIKKFDDMNSDDIALVVHNYKSNKILTYRWNEIISTKSFDIAKSLKLATPNIVKDTKIAGDVVFLDISVPDGKGSFESFTIYINVVSGKLSKNPQ